MSIPFLLSLNLIEKNGNEFWKQEWAYNVLLFTVRQSQDFPKLSSIVGGNIDTTMTVIWKCFAIASFWHGFISSMGNAVVFLGGLPLSGKLGLTLLSF